MSSLGRFILRLLVVPFGALAALCVAEMVVIFINWHNFIELLTKAQRSSEDAAVALMFVAPLVFLQLAWAAFSMMLPAVVGVAIAEGLAIRSWIYHAANGAISAWIGWSLIDLRSDGHFFDQPTIVLAAGLAAGFAYWLIAGWSSGFWKPAFEAAGPVTPGSPRRT